MKILQLNLNRSTFVVWEMKNPFIQRRLVFGVGVPVAHNWANLLWCNRHSIFNTFVNQLDYEELSIGYFQQDEATSHTSHTSMAEIQSFFGDCVILEGLWPLCWPNLTPPDYFLWGYLKGSVYQNKPWTIDALKANITREIHVVTADVLTRTFQNMVRRVQSCLDANGGHFQHMLWCRHISYTMR